MRPNPRAPLPALLVAVAVLAPAPAAADGEATPPVTLADAGEQRSAPDRPDEATGDETLADSINDVFSPIARRAAEVMFWDPFAALGLYDPVLYDDDGVPLRDEEGEVKTLSFPLVVVWLIFTSAFFTIRLRFINFRGFRHAIALLRGRYDDPSAPGEVTHFQALATAVSGTVGLGNIAGVALAISIGGPGASFWLVVAGLLGMATKFAECTLGVKYRRISDSGEVSGGPPYYLSRGLAAHDLPRLGKALAVAWAFFAIFGALGGGNMFQANQSFNMAAQTFPFLEGNQVWFGLALAVLVGVVIIGGIKEIGRVTGALVPAMAALYISSCLFIIFSNLSQIDDVIALILKGAFTDTAAEGGILGAMVIGLRRAAFSNEAGVGTAAIAHSAARTREPAAEGYVGLHEPFIDTVVVCSMTAFVIIITGHYNTGDGAEGATLTAAAFGTVASWFPYVLTFAIVLFSFSTQISFSYYGATCFDYVFGGIFERVLGRREIAVHFFRGIFLCFVIVGSASSVDAVVAFSDLIIFGLIITNTIGLYILSSEVRAELLSYSRRLARGEIKRTR